MRFGEVLQNEGNLKYWEELKREVELNGHFLEQKIFVCIISSEWKSHRGTLTGIHDLLSLFQLKEISS